MAPEMPTAMYILGATVWPELPTWRSMGSQPASQMGRDAASSAPRASASSWTSGMLLGFLDAAADGDDDLGGAQVHGALRLRGTVRRGLVRMSDAESWGVKLSTGAEPALDAIRAIRAGLQRGEVGRLRQ